MKGTGVPSGTDEPIRLEAVTTAEKEEIKFGCKAWIILMTFLLLCMAPVKTTKKTYSGTDVQIEWIGPFGEPKIYGHQKGPIDFSRLFVALLIVNGLPALFLWQTRTRPSFKP